MFLDYLVFRVLFYFSHVDLGRAVALLCVLDQVTPLLVVAVIIFSGLIQKAVKEDETKHKIPEDSSTLLCVCVTNFLLPIFLSLKALNPSPLLNLNVKKNWNCNDLKD